MNLKAPFTYVGGKRSVAREAWKRFGPREIQHYIEPFFGSGAVLLARPENHRGGFGLEIANDLNGFVSNFWRAIQVDPAAVAEHADHPCNENDMHARHAWLLSYKDSLRTRLEGDPEWFDVKIAGWWVWGASIWLAAEWCEPCGPWIVIDKELINQREFSKRDSRVKPKGVTRRIPELAGSQLPDREKMIEWFYTLSDRLKDVRIACGDWSRVLSPSCLGQTTKGAMTAIFMDPPYGVGSESDSRMYGRHNNVWVAREAAKWCRENESNPRLRIALCGYESEHEMPGWSKFEWSARGGYGLFSSDSESAGRENSKKEVIWFSPHCLDLPESYQQELIDPRRLNFPIRSQSGILSER